MYCGCFIVPMGHRATKRFSWLSAEGHANLWNRFCHLFLEKVIKVLTPSRVIWIRFDRGRPLMRTRFQRIKQKGYLNDTKISFEIYILQNIESCLISSSDMLNWPAWKPDVLVFHLDPVRTQTSETNTIIGVAFLRPSNSPISLPFPLLSKYLNAHVQLEEVVKSHYHSSLDVGV